MIVKISPADVVSIPSDYNNAKGRACKYEVIGEIGNDNGEVDTAFSKPVQSNATNNIHKPVAPVASEPKLGANEFYRGYTDGFKGKVYNPLNNSTRDYTEGYEKGESDGQDGRNPRYQYVSTPAGWTRHADGKVSPPPGTVFTAQTGSWPNPR